MIIRQQHHAVSRNCILLLFIYRKFLQTNFLEQIHIIFTCYLHVQFLVNFSFCCYFVFILRFFICIFTCMKLNNES